VSRQGFAPFGLDDRSARIANAVCVADVRFETGRAPRDAAARGRPRCCDLLHAGAFGRSSWLAPAFSEPLHAGESW